MILLAAVALALDTPQHISLVRQVEPRFPRAAKKLGPQHVECSVLVRVTAEGVPDDVSPLACDELFVAPTVAAVQRWRFEVDPPSPAAFRVIVTYDWPRRAEGEPAPAMAPAEPPSPETEIPAPEGEPAEAAPPPEEPATPDTPGP